MERALNELPPATYSSYLYVGWRHDTRDWWYDFIVPRFHTETVDVLDIFPDNLKDLQLEHNLCERFPRLHDCILGDVRQINELQRRWDFVFWDGGPEHVPAADLTSTTEMLKACTNQVLFYACPWGDWPQEPSDGNVHERHVNSLEPADLRALEMTVHATGASGESNRGELIAFWKRVT